PSFVFGTSKQSSTTSTILNGNLFATAAEQTAQSNRPSSLCKQMANLVTNPRMATYEIYDDTSRFRAATPTLPETPNSSLARRRAQFRVSSKQSKSFDSPLKTPGDPLKDSYDLTSGESSCYLHNVEQ